MGEQEVLVGGLGGTLANVWVRVDGGWECGMGLVWGVFGVFGLVGVLVCVCGGVVVLRCALYPLCDSVSEFVQGVCFGC